MEKFFMVSRYFILFVMLGAGVARGEFPALYNSEPGDPQPTPPEQALAMLHLPEGFKATLFAAEPDVQNPVAMAWDTKGRMWVAENYTYAERAKRFDLSLHDRVIILEDKDNDGVAETRKVFTDDVQMLTSVEVGRGGVWLMCPPQVLFIPDANGDDVPDGPPQVVLDGFTVAKDNYHNFANGLRWGPDGWLYGRCGHSCPGLLGVPGTPDAERIPIHGGIWRFNPGRGVVEVLTHGTTNPWGHDWDANGEMFFVNTVTGHLWHLIPGAHLVDSSPSVNPGVYERLDTIADHYHFDTKGSWTDSRDGKANSLGGGHAHIGMMIYQADQWPEYYRNKLYTINMHGRRTNVERLERMGSGYVGRHEPDIFLSDDPWFRGIDIRTGPDGSAFIIDWSDTGECHESTGVHRTSGRVFKISYGTPTARELPGITGADPITIERLLYAKNEWDVRRYRQILFSWRNDHPNDPILKEIGDSLEKSLFLKQPPKATLRALWYLNAIGLDPHSTFNHGNIAWIQMVQRLLDHDEEKVRCWAIRLLTDSWPLDTIISTRGLARGAPDDVGWTNAAAFSKLLELAHSDPSSAVRLVLASTLQRVPLQRRAELAALLVAHAEDAQDKFLPSMVWYGLIPLGDSAPEALVSVAQTCKWPDTLRWITRNLAGRIESNPDPLNHLLGESVKMPDDLREAVLRGVGEALQGWRKAPKPAAWDGFAASFGKDKKTAVALRDLGTLFGDGRALDEVKKVALDPKADLAMRTAALKTLIDARPPDLQKICESLLETRGLNATAARGLALFDDPAIAQELANHYRKFAPDDRPTVIATLSARPAFAKVLLDQLAAKKIPATELSAFQARQIRSLNDETLSKQLAEVWGELRDSAADKQKLIADLKQKLTPAVLAKADLSKGRMLFQICAACHTLYGEGGKIGPDLTGSGRANLDYLLENIADPSGVVSADFRMVILTLKDGRVLSGVIARQDARTLTLRMVTEETTVEKSEIAKQDVSPVSMMPEGLLLALQPDQVRDLIAYLMHPTQVAMPTAK